MLRVLERIELVATVALCAAMAALCGFTAFALARCFVGGIFHGVA
jgi:hypothetical protein